MDFNYLGRSIIFFSSYLSLGLNFGCHNPQKSEKEIYGNKYVTIKKNNVDGISFGLSKIEGRYEFNTNWHDLNNEVMQSQYQIQSEQINEKKVIKWGESFNALSCDQPGEMRVSVQRLYAGKVIEEQEYQLNCPLDVQAGNVDSELRLVEMMNQSDTNTLYLGEVYLNSDKPLIVPINREVKISILKINSPDKGAWITLLPSPQLADQYKKRSFLLGLSQTYKKWETHPAFLEQLSVNGELRAWLVDQKVEANYLVLPRAELEIGEIQGQLFVQSLGINGPEGKASHLTFSNRYERTKAIVAPPNPAANDQFKYQSTPVAGGRSFRELVCIEKGVSGVKGNPGLIEGAPGVDGGPGLPPIGLDITILKISGPASLLVAQSPSKGGMASFPGVGQSGSVGGLGGIMACENASSRYPSGPQGDSAKQGPAGSSGVDSGCSKINVSGPSNLSIKSKFEACPASLQSNYLNIKNMPLTLDKLNYVKPMKAIEKQVSTIGESNNPFTKHPIEQVIE